MKICIVSPLFHSTLGGVGRQAVLLTAKLRGLGLDLFVLSRRMKNAPEFKAPSNVDVYYIPAFRPKVHILEEKSFPNLLTSLSFSLLLAYKLFIMRKEYNLVHFHGASLPLCICLPLLKLLGKRVSAKVLSSRLGTEAGSLSGRYLFIGNMLAWIMRYTDVFVAISQEIADGLKKEGVHPEKIKNLTNFVDTSEFHPINTKKRDILKSDLSIDKDIVINFTGRIVERKGIDVLVKALAKSGEILSSSVLIIIGIGSYENEIKNLVSKYGIDNNIRLFGYKSEVVKYYQASDIFVLSSYAEGMSNSLLEAMACGLPVIAARIGGVVDIIEDEKSGILFEPGDVSHLSSAIVRLSKDAGLRQRLGKEARKRIVENFSIDKVVKEYIKLFMQTIEKNE